MVYLSGVASKVPGWVERMLIPALEAKVRTIVTEEFAHFEKVIDARFGATDARFGAMEDKIAATNSSMNAGFDAMTSSVDARLEIVSARIDALNSKIDSLEKRFPAVQEIAEIKARLNAIERERR